MFMYFRLEYFFIETLKNNQCLYIYLFEIVFICFLEQSTLVYIYIEIMEYLIYSPGCIKKTIFYSLQMNKLLHMRI